MSSVSCASQRSLSYFWRGLGASRVSAWSNRSLQLNDNAFGTDVTTRTWQTVTKCAES